MRAISDSMNARGPSCIACKLLRRPRTHDHPLRECILCPNPFTTHKEQYRLFRAKIKFPSRTCYQCGCPQNVSSVSLSQRAVLTRLQLKFTDTEGICVPLHDYNDQVHCAWANTFLIVAWLVRLDSELQAELHHVLPAGLDFVPCPFELWLTAEDYIKPLSNLLALYHFFVDRL